MKILTYYFYLSLLAALLFIFSCQRTERQTQTTTPDNTQTQMGEMLFKNATIINGESAESMENTDLLVRDGRIVEIGPNLQAENAEIIDLQGKTIMPALISAHVHVGNLRGKEVHGNFFSQDNVLKHLKRYQDYGVLHVMSLGTDRKILFENDFYSEVQKGQKEGARMFSAGWGFGVKDGAPPFEDHEGDDNVFRPTNTEVVSQYLDSLNIYDIQWVKLWLDDFGETDTQKMEPPIYQTIIQESKKRNMQVAAHLYYLEDGKRLARAGVHNFAHSIRDAQVDQEVIDLMKQHNISYIPTLTLDEFEIVYEQGNQPNWFNSHFFRQALESDVRNEIALSDLSNNPSSEDLARKQTALQNALTNVKKLYDAGILVGYGTDSGAQLRRPMGFSEHRELELLVQAGLQPWQAIQTATINSAKILGIENDFGSISIGKVADFLILNNNPLENISHTQNIHAVYKGGKKVSQGPLGESQ